MCLFVLGFFVCLFMFFISVFRGRDFSLLKKMRVHFSLSHFAMTQAVVVNTWRGGGFARWKVRSITKEAVNHEIILGTARMEGGSNR